MTYYLILQVIQLLFFRPVLGRFEHLFHKPGTPDSTRSGGLRTHRAVYPGEQALLRVQILGLNLGGNDKAVIH